MKNLLLALFTFLSIYLNAQQGQISLSIGPSVADPVNTSTTRYFTKGIGGGIRGYYGLSKNGSLMANFNYVSFGNNPSSTLSYSMNYSLTSYKLGYKTFINNSDFYVYGDAGFVRTNSMSKSLSTSANSTRFGLGTGLGYSLKLGKSYIDISPSLNYTRNAFRQLSPELNISYRFDLKRK